MSFVGHTDQYADHIAHVDKIRAAGGVIPKEWDAIYQRYNTFQDDSTTFAARLVRAITAPLATERLDIETLSVLALAHTSSSLVSQADMSNEVRREVGPALVRAYRPVAGKNYQQIAATFDSLGYEFESLARIIDPETPAEQMVNADDEQRQSWSRAQFLAQELTAVVPVLHAAAILDGINAHSSDDTLPLVIDPAELPRRAVWDAWETEGRTGHWGALVKLGATIKAADADSFKRYRRPRELEVVQIHTAGPIGGVRQVTIDPEGDRDAQINEHRRLLGL